MRDTQVRRDDTRGERGAAALEFALLAGLFFAIIFGIMEVGFLFRAKHSVEHGVAEAARRGSVAGVDPTADFLILEQLQKELADGGESIQRVVIYRATDPTQDPHPSCLNGGGGNPGHQCNVYLPADLDRPVSDFGSCGIDGAWCPTNRNDSLADPDFLAVWVETEHQAAFGILDDLTLSEKAVMPLEPARRS